MRYVLVLLIVVSSFGVGLAFAQTAAEPPSVRVMTFLPAALEASSRPFAEQLHQQLSTFMTANPNLLLQTDGEITVVQRAADIPTGIPDDTDYVLYAQILRTQGSETSVAVTLMSLPAREVLDTRRFRSNETDLSQFTEIAVESLLGKLLAPHLGIIRVEANEEPASIRGFSVSGGALLRAFPASLFRTVTLPNGVALLSRPLLEGEYEVTLEFRGLPPMRKVVRVIPGESATIAVNTGRLAVATRPTPTLPTNRRPESPPTRTPASTVPATTAATLYLTNLVPGQVISLSRQGEPPMAAQFVCAVRGIYTLEWTLGMAAVTVGAGTTPATSVLKGVPEGTYVVGTWKEPGRAYGKALFSGWGLTKSVAVGRDTSVSLALPAQKPEVGRLNLFWTPPGPPQGASLFVDDRYVGEVYDAVEAGILGLPAGERRLRFAARGFAPVERTVRVGSDAETSVFLSLSVH